jgi:hypothetical protein
LAVYAVAGYEGWVYAGREEAEEVGEEVCGKRGGGGEVPG